MCFVICLAYGSSIIIYRTFWFITKIFECFGTSNCTYALLNRCSRFVDSIQSIFCKSIWSKRSWLLYFNNLSVIILNFNNLYSDTKKINSLESIYIRCSEIFFRFEIDEKLLKTSYTFNTNVLYWMGCISILDSYSWLCWLEDASSLSYNE